MKKVLLLSLFLLNLLSIITNNSIGSLQIKAQSMGSEVTYYPCKEWDTQKMDYDWHFSTSPCDNNLPGACVTVCKYCHNSMSCDNAAYHSCPGMYNQDQPQYPYYPPSPSSTPIPTPSTGVGGGISGGAGNSGVGSHNVETKSPEQKAVDVLNKNANESSKGKCAMYVRWALEAEGVNTDGHPVSACDYGPFLLKRGFKTVPNSSSKQLGDIRVWSAFGKHLNGHIDMWNGKQWVSDFREKNEYVCTVYKEYSSYKTYRRK